MKIFFISAILSVTLLTSIPHFNTLPPKTLHFISPSYSTYCDTPLSR